jgi:hypothetical protein
MIIWPVKPPNSWASTGQYNGNMRIEAELTNELKYRMRVNSNLTGLSDDVANFVNSHESSKLVIPYKSNRCVIFDSAYIHSTDKVRFGRGYTSRRINLTFLFGNVNHTCVDAAAWRQATSSAAKLTRQEKAESAASTRNVLLSR